MVKKICTASFVSIALVFSAFGGLVPLTASAATLYSENFDEVTAPGLPAGWVGTEQWGTFDTGDPSIGNVLYGDSLDFPYLPNKNSTAITPAIDLSSAATSGANLSFITRCETEYTLPTATSSDYMALELSPDGSTFSEFMRWNRFTFDQNAFLPVLHQFTGLALPAADLTSHFTMRFRWVTNAEDNIYDGCYIDNLLITGTGTTTGNNGGGGTTTPSIAFSGSSPANGSTISASSTIIGLTTTDQENHEAFVSLDHDLKFWSPMSAASGAMPVDLAGNSTITSVNAPTQDMGVFGSSTNFIGSSLQYMTVGASYAPLPAFTDSFWINPDGTANGNATILRLGDADVRLANNTNLRFSDGENGYEIDNVITPSTWNHVVVTGGNNQVKIYVNGQLRSTQNFIDAGDGVDRSIQSPLTTIGRYFTDGRADAGYYTGKLDEVMIFGRALDGGEVLSLFNAGANQYSHQFTVLANGTHTAQGFSQNTDGVMGNTSTLSFIVTGGTGTTTATSTVPVITVVSPLNNSIASSTVPVNITLNQTGVCSYILDSTSTSVSLAASSNNLSFSGSLSGLTAGSHTLALTCSPLTGNATATSTVLFTVNSGGTGNGQLPFVSNAVIGSYPAHLGEVDLTLTFNDQGGAGMDTSVSPVVTINGLSGSPYTVNQTSYSSTTWMGSFNLLDQNEMATGTIAVTGARDVSGNVMSDNLSAGSFAVDTVSILGPQAVLTGAPSGVITGTSTITITVGGTNVASYKYRIDGGAFGAETSTSTPITLSGVNPGFHTIEVIGKDSTGVWRSLNAATKASWLQSGDGFNATSDSNGTVVNVTGNGTSVFVPSGYSGGGTSTLTLIANGTNGSINFSNSTSTFASPVSLASPLLIQASTTLGMVTLAIPANAVISGSANWNGIFNFPALEASSTVAIVPDSGQNAAFSAGIVLGSIGNDLTSSKGMRIFIPGQGGKSVGFISGGVFTPITTICTDDSQVTGDALSPSVACKLTSGNDLIIWTKHMSEYITYTQTPVAAVAGGGGGAVASGGGGGGGGIIYPYAGRGDLNGDGKINLADLNLLMAAWGKSNSSADFNSDGTVDLKDLNILMSNWK